MLHSLCTKSSVIIAYIYYSDFPLNGCAEYNLRNLEGTLALPKPHTNYLKQVFATVGSSYGTIDLPQEMRDADSIGHFKRQILNQISDISGSHTAIM